MSKVLKWLDNFWYHYKWVAIIVTFFLIIGIILIVQLVGRTHYDAYIMYMGNSSIPDTKYQDIMDAFDKVMDDYNGDGEVLLNFSRTNYISDDENPMAGSINSTALQYMSTMTVQPYYIYLIDAELYELYRDSDIFVPVTELVDDIPEEWLYDDTAVYFDVTDFAVGNAGVNDLGSDTLLVIKNIPYTSSDSVYEAEKEAFDHHVDLLRKILEY